MNARRREVGQGPGEVDRTAARVDREVRNDTVEVTENAELQVPPLTLPEDGLGPELDLAPRDTNDEGPLLPLVVRNALLDALLVSDLVLDPPRIVDGLAVDELGMQKVEPHGVERNGPEDPPSDARQDPRLEELPGEPLHAVPPQFLIFPLFQASIGGG